MHFLCHHGVKGQHWGIKNGPPYPLNEEHSIKYHTVPSGTRIFRATESDNTNFMNRKYTYVNVVDGVPKKYQYAEHLINTTEGFEGRFNYDHFMKAKKDLKIASSDEYFKAVTQSNGIDPDIYLKDVGKGISRKGKYAVENILPHKLLEADGGNYSYSNNAIQWLIEKGYDGVIDPIDGAHQQKRKEKQMATIIFNPKETLIIEGTYER